MTGSSAGFWDAIGPAAKEDFLSQADKRTFGGGARLMNEGETADHVIVILDGHTRICVEDDGRERVVAHRGPGQLIGERAALQVSVRSATVIAEGTVHALAMKTGDFAAFISAHPDVLDIVQDHVYGRLTENPARRGRDRIHPVRENDPGRPGPPAAPGYPRLLSGQYCLVIFTDVVGFGALARSEDHRRVVREAMREMTRASLSAIWDQCSCEDRGDGLLVTVPPDIAAVQVLEYLLIALPIALKRHNGLYAAGAQIQLRVALDVGPVTCGPPGVSGRVIIDAARLLDAPAFKQAVCENHANRGIIVSDFVYRTVVQDAAHLTDPATYTEVQADVKELSTRAWMTMVGPPLEMPPPWRALASLRMSA